MIDFLITIAEVGWLPWRVRLDAMTLAAWLIGAIA